MPTTPWDIFGTDQSLEKTGVWLDYTDFKFKIASTGSGNEKYKRVLKLVFKPYERQVQQNLLGDEKAEELLIKVFAKSIVLDWWCSEWGDGTMWGPDKEQLAFSEDNVIKLFTSMPRMFEMVRDEAQRAENFRQQEEDAAVKNSPRSSTTSSEQVETKPKS